MASKCIATREHNGIAGQCNTTAVYGCVNCGAELCEYCKDTVCPETPMDNSFGSSKGNGPHELEVL